MSKPWKRREVIGDITMYEGDCMDILPAINFRADAVVTDVPYGISQASNGLRRLDFGEWDHESATPTALIALSQFADCPTVIAWCDWRQLSSIADIFSGRSERSLTWAKPNPPVLNGQHLFLSSTEHAFYGKLPGAWFSGGCQKSYWIGPPPPNRQHPTEKPIWLISRCVQSCVPPGGLCVDPFMGSGTTLVACAKQGRAGIGIELDPDYFDIACKRVEEAYRQTDLFVAPPAPKETQIDAFAEDAA